MTKRGTLPLENLGGRRQKVSSCGPRSSALASLTVGSLSAFGDSQRQRQPYCPPTPEQDNIKTHPHPWSGILTGRMRPCLKEGRSSLDESSRHGVNSCQVAGFSPDSVGGDFAGFLQVFVESPPLPVLLPGLVAESTQGVACPLVIYLGGQAKPWQPWQIQSGRLIGLA